jgi:hypothetical protein
MLFHKRIAHKSPIAKPNHAKIQPKLNCLDIYCENET